MKGDLAAVVARFLDCPPGEPEYTEASKQGAHGKSCGHEELREGHFNFLRRKLAPKCRPTLAAMQRVSFTRKTAICVPAIASKWF